MAAALVVSCLHSSRDLVQVKVSYVAIALDYKLDESYTPSKLSIRAGTGYHDLKELKVIEVNEPNGWQLVQLEPPNPECVPSGQSRPA